jgi:uroporphyrin-3 C-methyltransferase
MNDMTIKDADAVTPDAGDAAAAPAEARVARTRSRWPTVLALLLLALAAAAVGVWLVTANGPEQRLLREQLSEVQTRLAGLQRDLEPTARLAEETAALREAMAREQASSATLRDELARVANATANRDPGADLNLALAEAEYLVLAAGQRLALEYDVESALAALASADARLQTMNHPDLIGIRERLAADISALRGVELPDTVGLAVFLADIEATADTLPGRTRVTGTPVELAPASAVPEAERQGWRGALAAFWQDLIGLVQVRDAELPDDVLFRPEQRDRLREALRLELASARLAVLRRDTENLRASVRLLTDWLERFYDVDAAAVRGLLDRLRGLAGLELRPVLPEVSASLDAIRAERARVAMVPEGIPVTP